MPSVVSVRSSMQEEATDGDRSHDLSQTPTADFSTTQASGDARMLLCNFYPHHISAFDIPDSFER